MAAVKFSHTPSYMILTVPARMRPDGSFLAVWTEALVHHDTDLFSDSHNDVSSRILAQIYSAAGVATGTPMEIAATPVGTTHPTVARRSRSCRGNG